MSVRANINSLPWDSEFFTQSIAKLTAINDSASPVLADDALCHYQLIQAKIAANDYLALGDLQPLGFEIVDGEVDLAIALNAKMGLPSDNLELATEQDIDQLKALAAHAFPLSRFRSPWFTPQDSQRFYSVWAEKAVTGQFDDYCLLIKDKTLNNNQPIIKGFITLKQSPNNEMRVGLLVVNADYRQQGIGELLVKGALSRGQQQGANCLRIATQTGNLAALRLYIKCGATIASSSYWLYRVMK